MGKPESDSLHVSISPESMQIMIERAQKACHDLRSTLAVLQGVTEELHQFGVPPQYQKVYQQAVDQVQEIASELNFHKVCHTLKRKNGQVASYQRLSEFIGILLEEKKNEYSKKVKAEFLAQLAEVSNDYATYINLADLQRTLSNLINNSVESLNEDGWVRVILRYDCYKIIIEIQDNGCGIPKGIVPEITEKGMSFNKPNGTGLGLYAAHQLMQAFGGRLEVFSEIKKGTLVRIILPAVVSPKMFH